MNKEFKINGNVVELEVENLTATNRYTIVTQLQYMVVSRELGYYSGMIEPIFEALVVNTTTPIDVFTGSFDEVIGFVEDNRDVIAEIMEYVDPDGSLHKSCIDAIEFRLSNFTGLQIADLVKQITTITSFIDKMSQADIMSEEMIDKLSDLSNAIKDLDTVEVAKMLAKGEK